MTAPPRTAELLLQSLGAPARYREPLLGDLAEGFATRVERDGVRPARLWYHRETMRAAPHVLREGLSSLNARDVRHIAGVVFAAYFFVMMLGFIASMIAGAVMSAWDIAPGGFARHGNPLFYVGYALGFACAVLGGAIAAWLDRRTPLLSTLMMGAAWALLNIVVTAFLEGGHAGWSRVFVPLTIVMGVTLGGVLRIRALDITEQGAAAQADLAR